MEKQITMPKLGVTMEEGRISAWRYDVGDYVEAGCVLVDIESDKLVNEYESMESGVLLEIYANAGDVVSVGSPICIIGETGEGAAIPAQEASSPEPLVAETPDEPTCRLNVPEAAVTSVSDSPGPSSWIKAMPRVRKFAKEQGVCLAEIKPTGYGGMITMNDVKAGMKEIDAAQASDAVAQTFRPVNILPLTGMRGAVAKKMSMSNENVPQGTQFWRVDATELLQLQSFMEPSIKRATGHNLSLTALLVKALGKAIPEHPILNSVIIENQILQYTSANIAVAVAVNNGLMTPVIHNAETLSLAEIVVMLRTLADNARKGSLRAVDLADATFVLTNLGMYGTRFFTPLINPPQTVMLGVGKVEEEAVVRGGQIVARPILPLSITLDHRAIDGVPAAQFMSRLKELLETPWSERIIDISF